jgi:hypothetical protein
MPFDSTKFEAVDKKIDEIRGKIDKGIMNPGLRGELALEQLRAARAELFALRGLFYSIMEIDQAEAPEGPSPAA